MREKGRGKPAAPEAAGSESLLTSSDLFGDLVDAPPEERKPPEGAGERRGPILVRIHEPRAIDGRPPGTDPGPGAKPPGPGLAGDFAALLDRIEPAGGETTAVALGSTETVVHASAAAPSARPDNEDALLAELVSAAMPPQAAEAVEPALPEIARRTAVRFRARGPRQEERPAEALDLSAVAEQAIAAPAGPAARRGAWREDVYGPYQLLDRIAVGGMAEVFKAKRSGAAGFEKIVAVKRILPHLSDNKEFVDMFVDEAKMVAGLSHPNIVQIFDLGHIDDSYFIAMEYVHGRDVRTILKRAQERQRPLPLELCLRVVAGVCAALEFAHRKKDGRGRAMQIVHRDVSPQNILISFEGDVKLTDFGIAKAATKASSTDRGALRGKLLYMSPEQAWGRTIDRRSDLFSLGVVLYEMVTGRRLFVAESELTSLELVRKAEITPPQTLEPKLPDSLNRLVMKVLARDPDARYQDAAELGRGLERVLRERPLPTAHDLMRYMELLFDRDEREEAIPEDLFPAGERKARPGPSGSAPGSDVPPRTERA